MSSMQSSWIIGTCVVVVGWSGAALAAPCPVAVDTDRDGTLDTAEDDNTNGDCNDDDGDGDGIADFLDCRDGDTDPATGVGVAGFDDLTRCMTDADGDGYGDDAVTPGGGLVAGTDCDDGDATTSPGAEPTEGDVGNGLDRDCDGYDECFFDADGDDHASSVVVADTGDGVCDDPLEGWQVSDCEDYDPEINPDETITGADVGDGVDRDCDGFDECYEDADGDGYGGGGFVADDGDGVCDDDGEDYAVRDCDDGARLISPGAIPTAADVGNGVDRDCDGLEECFFDADVDGYGDEIFAELGNGLCDNATESEVGGDCEDNDPDINPDATVSGAHVGDGLDRDCDGFDECYEDEDGDGYGGDGFVADDGDGVCDDDGEDDAVRDCDDDAGLISPGATATAADVDNGVDRDCDGLDECFSDVDGDGYGGAIIADDGDGSCDDSTEVDEGGDCEDMDADIHPGATEVCDDQDNDCVDGVDDGFVCGRPDAGAAPVDEDAGVDAPDAATGDAGPSSGEPGGVPVGNTGVGGTGGTGATADGSGTRVDGGADAAGMSDGDEPGCGCRTIGTVGGPDVRTTWLALLLCVGVAWRRRRPRSRPKLG